MVIVEARVLARQAGGGVAGIDGHKAKRRSGLRLGRLATPSLRWGRFGGEGITPCGLCQHAERRLGVRPRLLTNPPRRWGWRDGETARRCGDLKNRIAYFLPDLAVSALTNGAAWGFFTSPLIRMSTGETGLP